MRFAIGVLFLSLAVSVHIAWTDKRPLPHGRAGGAAFLPGGDLVLAGGTWWDHDVKYWLDSVLIYDTVSDRWRIGPPLPSKLAYGGYTITQHGPEIFGGNDGQRNHRECWALEKERWVKTSVLPDDRLFAGTVQVGGTTYLIGGCQSYTDLRSCTDSVLARGSSGTWHTVSKIPNGRVSMSAVAVARGRIYVLGGCTMSASERVSDTKTAYVYDPLRNSWTLLRDLPEPSRGPSAVVFRDRYLFLLGGTRPAPGRDDVDFSRSVLVYDIQTDTYRAATSLPVGLVGTDFFLHGDTFYGAGGEDRMKGRSARLLSGRITFPFN